MRQRLCCLIALLASTSIRADGFFAYWTIGFGVPAWSDPAASSQAEPIAAEWEAVTTTRYRRVCHGDYCTIEPYTTTEWRRVK